ncbi:MAG: polysaccharide pyruvyl transferase family protein [Beijerinckiaceae bacterium]
MLGTDVTPVAAATPSPTEAEPSPWPAGVRLSWARASDEVPYANLGDALSALIVAAISGRAVEHADFDADAERMVGIGTIVQDQRRGVLHLWGSGIDTTIHPTTGAEPSFGAPADTRFVVHAVRGPRTAAVLRRAGIAAPPVFGDPAWFLPKILPRGMFPPPTHELGVITHISELAELTPEAAPHPSFPRYAVGDGERAGVRFINTLTAPNLPAIIAKVGEILSCRRILSSSFHGLVIPLAYGVPALTFGFPGHGFRRVDASDAVALDHRFSDFFQGVGLRSVPAVFSDRARPTDSWDALARMVDEAHVPLGWTGRDLFDAFPGRKAVVFDDPRWPIPSGLRRGFRF